jgi:Subtilase family
VRRIAAALLALGLAGAASAQPAAQPTPPSPAPSAAADAQPAAPRSDDPEARQILVMLRLPPAHFRADRDYAGDWGDLADRSAQRRLAARVARDQRLQLLNDWPVPSLGLDCFVMGLPVDLSATQAIAALSSDTRVVWAQPVHVFRGRETRAPAPLDDPLLAAQPAAAAWHLAELHRVATGRGIDVAVIDSGVEADHPDLAGSVVWNENFADQAAHAADAHGTAVAGIVAARSHNGVGIAGVAPDARIMALRACRQDADGGTRCNSFTLSQALQFAIRHEAQVINLSLAGPPDRLLGALVDAALQRGISVVSAVDPALAGGGFPASQPGVIAVLDDDGAAASTAGVWKAPGRDVPTSLPGARWGLVSGSSFAAAHVSGLVALMRELRPKAGGAAVVHSAAGQIDACATLSRLSAACVCDCTAALAPVSHAEAVR